MKKRLVFCLALCAQSLAAQQIVAVQSGDHEGFSRLVLQIDPDLNWEINETPGFATIRFPARALSFSTGSVFDLISTERIVGLREITSPQASELRIELSCECDVQSFAYQGRYIVLDVHDGPELEIANVSEAASMWHPDSLPLVQPPNVPSRFDAFVMQTAPSQPTLLPDPPAASATSKQAPDLADPSARDTFMILAPDEALALEDGLSDDSNNVEEIESSVDLVISNMIAKEDQQENPELVSRIEAAQAQLLTQLTRAADQGLIEFAPTPVEVVEAEAPEVIAPPLASEPVNNPQLLQQLSARTAYGQGAEDALTEIVNQFAMPQCLEGQLLLMAGWGGELDFHDQLASLRTNLMGEFDIADQAVSEAIIQLYLRYGFGTEARLMLAEFGHDLENAALYKDMADIFAGQLMGLAGPIVDGAGCGGAHEMWYLVAGLGDYLVLEPLEITDVFSSYPIEVRTLLGPALAQAFNRRGQVDAAHVVLEIVRRAEGDVTPAQRMAEASVLETQLNFRDALQIYGELSQSNDVVAPQALISYARLLRKLEEPIPPALMVDFETATFLNRDTEYADELMLSEIRVRAVVEGQQEALNQVVENLIEHPGLGAELRKIIADIFLESSASDMEDYRYAQMVLQFAPELDQGRAADDARNKIAEELSVMGLPEPAINVLSPNLSRGNQRSKHIAAKAFVQLFLPNRALDILESDASLSAYEIRLAAYLQLENHEAVAEMLSEDFAEEIISEDILLRIGEKMARDQANADERLASNGQALGRQTDEVAANISDIAANQPPSLSATRALLADNRESRSFIEKIIAEGLN